MHQPDTNYDNFVHLSVFNTEFFATVLRVPVIILQELIAHASGGLVIVVSLLRVLYLVLGVSVLGSQLIGTLQG